MADAAAENSSYYLTTPIYYVNGVPHLGTAYTTIAADALARFERMDGRDTWFLTGLDEHGQKVAQAAEAKGVSPQEWVDSVAPQFLDAWEALSISNDDFIRTTEQRHIQGVQRFFEQMRANGYIYQDTYEGFYCVPEETFFTDEQLADFAAAAAVEGCPSTDESGAKLCPDCGRPLSFVQEDNLFFKLSAFQDRLLAYYEENPGFICPEIRRNEVLSFVRGGLKDLSISRTTFNWGVPIPFAPGHVSYVWVDALINYITAVGYGSDDPVKQAEFAKRWPCQVHFVGKDIIRFHCVIWPAMLMAAGIEPPGKVFAHGFLLTKGEKMSKSKGNATSPLELAKIFSVDGYRYYFLTDVQFGADGSISLERMVQVYNADLANSWGNLCSRAFNMTSKYCAGRVPELWEKTAARLTQEMGNPLAELAEGLYERYARAMNAIDYSSAYAAVMELCDRANLYIEESTPWTLAKQAAAEAEEAAAAGVSLDDATAPTAADRLSFVLYNILESIRIMALFFAPVMPNTSAEVFGRLGLGDVFGGDGLQAATRWGGLPAGNEVIIGEPLFPRLKEEEL
ncbi:MAG: methionine--tRNA ligase [Coriobacteriales bacterium]|jgi:methionyl-tRNA synthetase|nr:methionine--tRNA ligase [Coriobacteriales bacterium]